MWEEFGAGLCWGSWWNDDASLPAQGLHHCTDFFYYFGVCGRIAFLGFQPSLLLGLYDPGDWLGGCEGRENNHRVSCIIKDLTW